jgi:hypothetical protein
MTTITIVCIFLGWLSYWIVKAPATIKGESPINSFNEFFSTNWQEFFISIIGVALLAIGADDLPAEWGKITGPFTAFLAGGSIPSIVMNAVRLFIRK